MNSNSFNSDETKIYVKPSIDALEMELESSILNGSGTGEGVNPEDTDF